MTNSEHYKARRRLESTLRDVMQKRRRAASVKRKKKHEKAEKEGKQQQQHRLFLAKQEVLSIPVNH